MNKFMGLHESRFDEKPFCVIKSIVNSYKENLDKGFKTGFQRVIGICRVANDFEEEDGDSDSDWED